MAEIYRIHVDIMDDKDECCTTNLFDPARGGTRPPLPQPLAARGITAADWDGVVDQLIFLQSTEPWYDCPSVRNWVLCFPGFVVQFMACLPLMCGLYWRRDCKLGGGCEQEAPQFMAKIDAHLRGVAVAKWVSSFDKNKGIKFLCATDKTGQPVAVQGGGAPPVQGMEQGGKEPCPMTLEDGKTLAQRLGLAIGGGGYAFAGNYANKGLYAYRSGKYAGRAYFGTGGAPAQMRARANGDERYRPWDRDDPRMPPAIRSALSRLGTQRLNELERLRAENTELRAGFNLTTAVPVQATAGLTTAQPVAPVGQTTVLAQIPAGLQPGQQFQVQAPGGQLVTVAVPAGVGPGSTIQVAVPATQSVQPVQQQAVWNPGLQPGFQQQPTVPYGATGAGAQQVVPMTMQMAQPPVQAAGAHQVIPLGAGTAPLGTMPLGTMPLGGAGAGGVIIL